MTTPTRRPRSAAALANAPAADDDPCLPPALRDMPSARFVEIVLRLRRESDARMAALGLTAAQWRPLWLIGSGVATTTQALARALGTDAGATTRMVDRLEAKGLVERRRSDDDRRRVDLALTPQAGSSLADVPAQLDALNRDMLDGLGESQRRALLRLLARVASNLHAMQARREAAGGA